MKFNLLQFVKIKKGHFNKTKTIDTFRLPVSRSQCVVCVKIKDFITKTATQYYQLLKKMAFFQVYFYQCAHVATECDKIKVSFSNTVEKLLESARHFPLGGGDAQEPGKEPKLMVSWGLSFILTSIQGK